MKDTTPQAVQACHELLRWLIPHRDKFPRVRRFTLGERLESVLLEVLEATVQSAYTRNKQQALQRANLRLDVARHLWRLSHVFQAIIRCPFNYLIAEHSMFILMSKQVFFMRWAVMNEVVLDIKQWGNNLGVRLPAAIARAAHLHVHQRVRLSVADGNIIITPVPDEPLTLEQRLADYDPVRHGGEVMNTRQGLGAEEW